MKNIQRLEMRCPKHVKQAIKQAAQIKGVTLSGFVIDSAMEEALKIIEKWNTRAK